MIDFVNVSKTYPNGTHALHNVSLHIDKGEFVFIVGASGAGKSTFLKLIMREEIATSGEIVINGNNLSTLKKRNVPYLRRHMGIVFQDFRLIEKMNVFDNVAFAMRCVGEKSSVIKKRVPYVLDLVGLKDKMKNKPSELSGGEQQRVSLARALVNNPEIIIADEPTGNIDPELSYEILELLIRINAMGTTVLVVTHEHELVREFNQRVISLDNGRVAGDSADADTAIAAIENTDVEYIEEYAEEEVPVTPVAEETPAAYEPEPAPAPAPQTAPVEIPAQPAAEPVEEEMQTDINALAVEIAEIEKAYAGTRFSADEPDDSFDEAPRYPDNAVKKPE
ncbi:MAG: cell division ATP-binding protein FtsE [Ruminococcus sp.]|nr:cell division ATP-binding protein FtsE [Ruminococcus sp.]